MNKFLGLLSSFLFFTLISAAPRNDADRVILFPKLHVGQILRYQVGFRATTNTSTESSVAAPMAPTGGQTNANILLQAEVEDLRGGAGETLARLRVRIIDPSDLAVNRGAPSNTAQPSHTEKGSAQPGKTLLLTLQRDGQVTDVQGLDRLAPDELAAWQEWVARFAGAAVFPENGVRPGQKWKREEPIANAMLAGLSWEKESEYVNNAPCAAVKLSRGGDPAAVQRPRETCAVILTTALLKQKSSPKDATPEDYKLHDLRNSGTARGKNQIISYFSLKTGLLLRASEDANQSMNLTVSKTDGSNQVHYSIDAESHAQVLLLADVPPEQP